MSGLKSKNDLHGAKCLRHLELHAKHLEEGAGHDEIGVVSHTGVTSALTCVTSEETGYK